MEMRSKKGMVFTLMAIAILAVFIFVFMIPGYQKPEKEMAVIEMRVSSMNNFIMALERDCERSLYISSYRAILSLEEYIINNGEFLSDTESSFKEALLNGTVNNKNSSFMVASTFPLWIEKIKEEASKFNIGVNITINNIDIYHSNPWHINVSANLTFFVYDSTDIAYWIRQKNIITTISIMNFEDPIYVVKSLGRVSNLINETPYEGNYTYKIRDEWNVENLLKHTEYSYYTFNQDAPNFLMRFENNLSDSPYGIESLVNINKLADQGLSINSESSIVDYFYWNDVENGDYRVNFTPSWFRLDQEHLAKYQVTEISYLD